jgi:uncharacterized protein YbaP (TraB family)
LYKFYLPLSVKGVDQLNSALVMDKFKQLSLLLVTIYLSHASVSIAQISEKPTFCWMVLSKDSLQPSFLFGTMHHLGPDFVLKNKQLMNFTMKSKCIILEADTSEMLNLSKEYYSLKTDTSIEDVLGLAEYQFVRNVFYKATGKEIDNYRFYIPHAILTLIRKAENEISLRESKRIMERAFYAISSVKNIPIYGLETREEVYNIMYKGMPLREQAKLLLAELKSEPLFEREEQMNQCFFNQDLSCFCAIDDLQHYTNPGDSIMVLGRNLHWINKIDNFIVEGNSFVAVGAAHLCGDFGIVALLKRRGHHLIPVKIF